MKEVGYDLIVVWEKEQYIFVGDRWPVIKDAEGQKGTWWYQMAKYNIKPFIELFISSRLH